MQKELPIHLSIIFIKFLLNNVMDESGRAPRKLWHTGHILILEGIPYLVEHP